MSPFRAEVQYWGADGRKPFLPRWEAGLWNLNTTESAMAGAVFQPVGLAARAAYFTSCRHGLTFLLDSTMTPLPICFLLP